MLKISGDVAIGHGCCRQIGLDLSIASHTIWKKEIIYTLLPPCPRLVVSFCRVLAVWWIHQAVGSLTDEPQ
jgi:hypothetical protein